jgi:hypothetical protein
MNKVKIIVIVCFLGFLIGCLIGHLNRPDQ